MMSEFADGIGVQPYKQSTTHTKPEIIAYAHMGSSNYPTPIILPLVGSDLSTSDTVPKVLSGSKSAQSTFGTVPIVL